MHMAVGDGDTGAGGAVTVDAGLTSATTGGAVTVTAGLASTSVQPGGAVTVTAWHSGLVVRSVSLLVLVVFRLVGSISLATGVETVNAGGPGVSGALTFMSGTSGSGASGEVVNRVLLLQRALVVQLPWVSAMVTQLLAALWVLLLDCQPRPPILHVALWRWQQGMVHYIYTPYFLTPLNENMYTSGGCRRPIWNLSR
jgi:hypothetical protein